MVPPLPSPIVPSAGLRLSRGLIGLALLATSLLVSAGQAHAATSIVHVRGDAPAGGDGQSWATAYDSLQTALALVSPTAENPVEIWIKTGVHYPTTGTDRNVSFVLKNHLTLRGGFAGTETSAGQRPAVSAATTFTVLSGDIGVRQSNPIHATSPIQDYESLTVDFTEAAFRDNSFNVVRAPGVAAALDRVVIAGGYADSASIPAVRVEAMLFPTTEAGAGFREAMEAGANGGGLHALHSLVTLRDSWLVGNFARGAGGALASRGGSIHLENTQVTRNFSGYAGGGAFLQATQISTLDGNTFYGNTAAFVGGGIFIQADTANNYLKSYFGTLLIGLAATTYEDPGVAPPDFVRDPKAATHLANAMKSSLAIAQAMATAVVKKIVTGAAATGLPASSVTTSLMSVANPLAKVYGGVSLLINVVDIGVALAQHLGVSPNDPFIRGWTTFSTGFATYASPAGLIKLFVGLFPGDPPPSFESRAYPIRLKDYEDNRNAGPRTVLRRNRFERNTSSGVGGGAFVLHANIVFSRTWFDSNNAVYGGGAAAAFGYNDVDFENSAIVRNASQFGASGLMFGYRTVNRLINNTITRNHAVSPFGYAVSGDAGSDTSLVNCVLWQNSHGVTTDPANPNRAGGADLSATRKADLDGDGLRAYNDAGDSRGLYTAIMDVQYCNVEGIARLAYGTALFYGYNASADASATLVADRQFNLGEGIRPAFGVRGNLSVDPLLLEDVYPHTRSPLINAGTPDYPFYRDNSSFDLVGGDRTIGRYDIGAVESNGTLPTGLILYVDASRPTSGDGLSWATAYKTLPEALGQALNPGSQIWVAQGTYYPTSGTSRGAHPTLAPGVSLIGGFASGASSISQSDPVARPTILSGNIGNAASIADNSYTLLDGRSFPATGAGEGLSWATYDAARKLPRIIRGFRFTAANSNSAAVRLAMPVILDQCVFIGNAGGRALSLEDPANLVYYSSAVIRDCTFEANTAGAIDAQVLKLELYRTAFYDNTAPSGAAIRHQHPSYNHYSVLKAERCVFQGNIASNGRGGAIDSDTWWLELTHSIVIDNRATPATGDSSLRGGAGIWWNVPPADLTRGGAGLSLVNSILHGNRLQGSLAATTSLEFQQFGMPDMPSYLAYSRRITGNDIEGLLTYATGPGASNNVDFDPFFVDADNRNFTLAADSYLINRGVPQSSPTDTTVPVGASDIGLSETPEVTSVRPLAALTFTALTPTEAGRQFTLALASVPPVATSFAWEVRRPGGAGFVTVANDSWTAGATTSQLTLTNPPRNWNGSLYRLTYRSSGLRLYSAEHTLNVAASFLYVVVGGAGTKDGSSWENAFASPSDAAQASSDGTQVWIARGTYAMPLTALPAGVRLFGGFVGNETSLAARPAFDLDATASGDRTRLTNNQQEGVFTVSGTGTFATQFDRLDFSRTGAGADPVIHATGANVRMQQVRVVQATSTGIVITGGQARIEDSRFDRVSWGGLRAEAGATLTVRRTAFLGNNALARYNYDGALTIAGSTATIEDCSFADNQGTFGGAITIAGASTVGVQRSLFSGNTSYNVHGSAGAIYSTSSGTTLVANSLIAGNTATYNQGGAVRQDGPGSFTLLHCTVVGNTSTYNFSAAVFGRSNLVLNNSIVWGNTGPGSSPNVGGGTVVLNSIVQGLGSPVFPFDPLFAGTSDFQLTAHSPAVDAAMADANAGELDLLGQPRRHGGGNADLGAYEFGAAPGTPIRIFQRTTSLVSYAENPVAATVVANVPFTWEVQDGATWVPMEGQPGWTVANEATTTSGFTSTTTTLTHLAAPGAFHGRTIRAVATTAPGFVLPLTLTVNPRYVRFVDARVAASGNGQSWGNAYRSITEALNAVDGGADLWIAGGTYAENSFGGYVGVAGATYVPVVPRVRYYPGFAGTESDVSARDLAAHPVELALGPATFPYDPATPTTAPTVPKAGTHLSTAPSSASAYVDRPALFTASLHSGSSSQFTLDWTYSADGFTWRPLSELAGNTRLFAASGSSTLTVRTVTAAMQGWRFRADVVGLAESSLPATLTVLPRYPLHVDAAVASSGNGSTWATAFKTIAEALAIADDGADVHVAGGLYEESRLGFPEGVRVLPSGVVRVQGPSSLLVFTGGSAFSQLRFHLAGPVRSQAAYIDKPIAFTATRAAWSDLPVTWQASTDNGASWQPATELTGWSTSSSGSVSTLSHASASLAMSGLQVRAVFGAAVEVSSPATLVVRPRYTLYVDVAAGTSGNGSNWATAFDTLQEALAVADNGADIWIAAGTYHEPTHAIVSGARLFGGFTGNETTLEQRDPSAHVVSLSSPAGSVFTATGALDPATTIDGITIAAGNADGAPGMYLVGGAAPGLTGVTFTGQAFALVAIGTPDLALVDCTFRGNVHGIDTNGGSLALAGCVFASNSGAAVSARQRCDVVIDRCDFTDNGTAGSGAGGAIRLFGTPGSASRPTISVSGSRFLRNHSIEGGAIGGTADATLVRSRFSGNSASRSGAIHLPSSIVEVRHSLFDANVGLAAGSASAISASRLTLTHVTAVDNVAASSGFAFDGRANLLIRNSILWGNSAAGSVSEFSAFSHGGGQASYTLDHAIIEGLTSGGEQVIPFSPRFLDPESGDFRLAADSPAIDFGDGAFVSTGELDLDGTPRLKLAAPDLGAFEATSATEPNFDFGLPVAISRVINGNFSLAQPVPAGFTSAWQRLDGDAWVNLVSTSNSPLAQSIVLQSNFVNGQVVASGLLEVNGLKAEADGLQLRNVLTRGSDSYVSGPITVSVIPFGIAYVDASRPAGGDGSSWATAYRTLHEALASVTATRRTIHVAAGAYPTTTGYVIPRGVTVLGGFPIGGGAIDTRDPEAHPVLLSGATPAQVVSFASDTAALPVAMVDGLTIANGQVGLRIDGQDPVLSNLVVTGHAGGGAEIRNSAARIASSVFESNGTTNGGAIAVLYTYGKRVVLDRVVLRANTATRGGGLYVLQSTVTLASSLVSGNVAISGGGLHVERGQLTVVNSTLAGNRSGDGAGAYAATSQAIIDLRNSIVWGNVATAGGPDPQLFSPLGHFASFVLDRTTVEQTTLTSGVIPQDPLFTAPAAAASAPTTTGDYTLPPWSPARNAGSNALAAGLALDLVGQPRIALTTVDLGAYEAQEAAATPLAITSQPGSFAFRRDGTGNTASVVATGASTIEWQIASPGGAWTSLVGDPAFSGATTSTLTALDPTVSRNGHRLRAVIVGTDTTLFSREAILTVRAPRYHVDASAPGGNGLTWATAFASLDTALGTIPFDPEGTELWIAAGTYTPATSFPIHAGLSVFGGFAGGESSLDARDPVTHLTELVGTAGQPFVVEVRSSPAGSLPVRVDGLVIRDSAGIGINNEAGRDLVVERVRFLGLRRALVQRGAAVTIRLSEFRGNGGPTVGEAPLSVQQAVSVIENTLFAGNSSTYASAASFNGGPTLLRHVTVAHNHGPRALLFSDPNTRIYNSILWGNRNGANTASISATGRLFVAANVVTESPAQLEYLFPNRSGLSSADPAFAAPASASATPTLAGDYRLTASSGAVDSGSNPESVGTLDLAGQPRLHGLHVDLGAYEYPDDDVYFIATHPADTHASTGSPATFTATASRAATFTWETSADLGESWIAVTTGISSLSSASSRLSVPGSALNDGHRFRSRVAFVTGPEVVTDSATLSFLGVTVTVDGPAGFSTPATFSADATQPVTAWQWQVSTNGGTTYADIPDAIAASLVVNGGAATHGHLYRARATFGGLTGSPSLVSNAVALAYANVVPTPLSATGPDFSVPGGLAPASLTDASFALHADLVGRLTFGADDLAVTIDGDNVEIDLATTLPAGSRVFATATEALRRSDGVGTRPRVWEFRSPVTSAPGFFDTAAPLGAGMATALAVGDLDGDGAVDLLLASSAGLHAIHNADLLAAHAGLVLPTAFGPAGASALALGSLGGEGPLDAVAIDAAGNLVILGNDGLGGFTVAQTIAGVSATAVALGDLDADGDLDVAAATTTGGRIFLNDGDGTLAPGASFGTEPGVSIAIGDFNRDGALDVVMPVASGPGYVWHNQGDATFVASPTMVPGNSGVTTADFNADGRLDLAFARTNLPITVLRGLESGGFALVSTQPGGGMATLAAGDTDGDGRVDLVLSDATGQTGAWLASSFATFGRAPDQLELGFSAAIALADLDGDGALDLVGLDGAGGPAVSLYRRLDTITNEDIPIAITLEAFEIVTPPALGDLTGTAPALTYDPDANVHGYDRFTYRLADGGPVFTHFIVVRPIVDEVQAVGDSIALAQGATATLLVGGATSVLGNDVSLDAGDFVASIVTRPSHGSLTLNADGSFAYVHDNTETRSDSFTYRARNVSTGIAADATVTIAITNVNEAPSVPTITLAPGTRYTGQASGAAIASFGAADPDPEDAGLLTFSLVPGAGSAGNADFALTPEGALTTSTSIDPETGLTRSIRVRATDPSGLFAEQSHVITFVRAPTAVAASVDVTEDTAKAFALVGLGGVAALTYAIVDGPDHGVLSGTAPSLTYTPGLNFNGSDALTFRVSDGALTSATVTVSLAVEPVNDDPIFYNGANLFGTEDVPFTFVLNGSDVDGDTLTYHSTLGAGAGVITFEGQVATLTPAPHFNGGTQFAIYATDGQGGSSENADFFLQVAPVPDTPTLAILPTERNLLKDTVDTFTATSTHVDGGAVSLQVFTPPEHGALSFDGLDVTYTPTTQYAGSDSYSLVAHNGSLGSDPVTITVNLSDPLPVALSQSTTINQRTSGFLFLNGSDPQGDAVTFETVTEPANGDWVIEIVDLGLGNFGRRLTYTPDPAFFGTDTYTYVTRDPNGQASEPATLTFHVTEDNLAPVAGDLARTVPGLSSAIAINLPATDDEGADLAVTIVDQPSHGTLSGDGLALTYTPAAVPFLGTDSFTYRVNDGVQDSAVATVSLTFEKDVRDPVPAFDAFDVYRGLRADLDVLANDTDPWGDDLFILDVTAPENGSVSIVSGKIRYQHNGNDATGDSFVYTVGNGTRSVTQIAFLNIRSRQMILAGGEGYPGNPDTLREALDIAALHADQTIAPAFTERADFTIIISPLLASGETLLSAAETHPEHGDSGLVIRGRVSILADPAQPFLLEAGPFEGARRLLRIAQFGEVSIRGVVFEGGTALRGGAILNDGMLSLEDVRFTGNAALGTSDAGGQGGAVFSTGTLQLQDVTLSDNEARASDDAVLPGQGGAIYNLGGAVTLDGVVFTDNEASQGGGLYQLGDGFGSDATVVAIDAIFSGHGEGKDFVSVARNQGTADFLAQQLAAESPGAPWVDVLPSRSVRSTYQATVGVLLDEAQTLTTSNLPSTVTGSGSFRTVTATTAPIPGYPPMAVAGANGVTFRRPFTFSIDAGVNNPPLPRDDLLALAPGESIILDDFAVQNDEDPDGDPIHGIFIQNLDVNGSIDLVAGRHVYTAPHGHASDTIVYALGSLTATIHVTVQPHDYAVTSDDAGSGSLREGIARSSTFTGQTWTFRPGADRQVVALAGSGASDPVNGDSALLITGRVVIDGSSHEGFTLLGDGSCRLFHVAPGGSLTLRHVTLSGGSASFGGAILNEGTLILDHATLSGNVATAADASSPGLGGAVFHAAGSLAVVDSTLVGNVAEDASALLTGRGAAIYARDIGFSVLRSSLIDNRADQGGGIFAESTLAAMEVSIEASTLDNGDSASDLAGTTSGAGTLAFHRIDSVIPRIAGPWISAIGNLVIDTIILEGESTTDVIPFVANDTLPDLDVSFLSSNGTVLPPSNVTLVEDELGRRVRIVATVTGVTDAQLVASSGAVSFHEHFRIFVNSGTSVPPTAWPQTAPVYPGDFVTIDPITGKVVDSRGIQLSGGNGPASDPYGMPLVIDSVTQPEHGTVTITSDNRIRYTHAGPIDIEGVEFLYTLRNPIFGGTVTSGVFVQLVIPGTTVTAAWQLRGAIAEAAEFPHVPWTITIDAGANATWTTEDFEGGIGTNAYYSAYEITANVIIDASGSPNFTLLTPPEGYTNPPLRHFLVREGGSLTLRHLRLFRGKAYAFQEPALGGAVANLGHFTAEHVTFESNTSYDPDGHGGALYNDGGTVVLSDCVFLSNSTAVGGAIYSRNGSLSLLRTFFSGNAAPVAPDLYVLADGSLATVSLVETTAAGTLFATMNGGIVDTGEPFVAPIAVDDAVERVLGQPFRISISALLANDIMVSPNLGRLTGFDATSNLGVSISRTGNFLLYQATPGLEVADSFTYTLSDVFGETTTATVLIGVVAPPPTASPQPVLSIGSTSETEITLRLAGVPGRTYTIEVSSDMQHWSTLTVATAGSQGFFTVVAPVPASGSSQFYRLVYLP